MKKGSRIKAGPEASAAEPPGGPRAAPQAGGTSSTMPNSGLVRLRRDRRSRAVKNAGVRREIGLDQIEVPHVASSGVRGDLPPRASVARNLQARHLQDIFNGLTAHPHGRTPIVKGLRFLSAINEAFETLPEYRSARPGFRHPQSYPASYGWIQPIRDNFAEPERPARRGQAS